MVYYGSVWLLGRHQGLGSGFEATRRALETCMLWFLSRFMGAYRVEVDCRTTFRLSLKGI